MKASRLVLVALSVLAAAPARAQLVSRASVPSAGGAANNASARCAVSGDGRFVAFTSEATNLVANDTNGRLDVFLRDRIAGTTVCVSRALGGNTGSNASDGAALSDDGRFVAFWSAAVDLVPVDTNGGTTDVFVYDVQTGLVELVSVDGAGLQTNGACVAPALSADGRFVAFGTSSTTLVPGPDTNNAVQDVIVRDRVLGTNVRASLDPAGVQFLGASQEPSISGDGRFVAFQSSGQVWVRDLLLGTTVRASSSSAGVAGNTPSYRPALSLDGRFVAFDSDASNLVAGDTNGHSDVFVKELATGVTTRASLTWTGGQITTIGFSAYAQISADGRFIAYDSDANDIVQEDHDFEYDVFVHDRVNLTTLLQTARSNGDALNCGGWEAALSSDGLTVCFESWSALEPSDTNPSSDVYARAWIPMTTSFCHGDGSVVPCPCNNNGAPGHGCDNSSFGAPGALLVGGGLPSLVADSLEMYVTSEVTSGVRLLLQGDGVDPYVPFGDGLRCVGGTLRRLYLVSEPVGTFTTFPPAGAEGFAQRATNRGDVLVPGSVRYYQVYYRDASTTHCPAPAGGTSNVSNGLWVTWL